MSPCALNPGQAAEFLGRFNGGEGREFEGAWHDATRGGLPPPLLRPPMPLAENYGFGQSMEADVAEYNRMLVPGGAIPLESGMSKWFQVEGRFMGEGGSMSSKLFLCYNFFPRFFNACVHAPKLC